MKAVCLKPRRTRTKRSPEFAFPECDPRLDLESYVCWRTEKVDVIRHDYVGADHPAVSFGPGAQEGVANSGICQVPSPLPRTDGHKNDSCLVEKDEDAFGRVSALLQRRGAIP